AHRSLPLPSFVRVTNVDNGSSAIVRVNDRGPFHDNREIDLSYASAARLDILRSGTGRVRVEAIDPLAWQRSNGGGANGSNADSSNTRQLAAQPTSAPTPASSEATDATAAQPSGSAVYLQVAALGSASSAEALKSRLQSD